MKVISIGTDRKLFEDNSAVLVRNLGYSSKMEELHIVVFSLKKLGLEPYSTGNLHIYPTNSSTRWHYVSDAYRIGKQIIGNPDARSGRGADQSVGFGNSGNVVISSQDPFETGLVGHFLKRKFNFPLQLQVHTDFFSTHFRNSFLNKIRVQIAKFLILRADGLRVVSFVISDSIKSHFPKLRTQIDILPIFVDIKKIFDRSATYYTPEQIPKSVLMFSRFTTEKRIDLGLEVFKKVLDKQKDAQMCIIGFGPEKKNLLQKIDKLNIGGNVKIEEWEDDLTAVYKRFEILLLTSEYEGYGMTLIEAGASGCPIVTTAVGLAKTDLFKNGENCFICPVGDVDCLSKAVINLIENSEKRKLFKERMQDSIKKIAITREEYISRYVNLLEKLL
ncbi:MAG: glycosyltransferase family 4 protein [Candidatus Paceibacterota bacterium]|jgi:glycosyltransferase involved in cell wall biosynthesis